jgi:hypothetical protein
MKYSLTDLRTLYDRKYFFTKERFFNYFTTFGKRETEIENYFQLYLRFPLYTEEELETVDYIIQKILAYPEKGPLYKSYRYGYEYKPNKKRVYFQNGEAIDSFYVNLNEEDDVIIYAEFLKRKPEIIAAVDFIEELREKGTNIEVYDGDVFSTSERWDRRRDGEVFMCRHGGSYRKLLYTQGRGYIRNGRPDIDEKDYNSHVLTLKDKFQFIGNVYADASFLLDPEMEEGDEDAE